MDEQKPSASGGNSWIHEPLPYVVRLRATADDDSAPRTSSHMVVAYSLLEAVMQAFYEAEGGVSNQGKYVVESVGPDVGEWRRLLHERILASAIGTGR